ncbi:hypothetical protein CUJ83_15010 [Methanocella sp. CWC-04]|uniref:Uncharacterized protein n=1 Tax=Methanooceanicella nereidis TaxID=2052831 RepID=A0AAP2REW9_9EURY|nr:hypothetical protein [Methanocella sp. CWC-04]MCD1296311.1 hypothetical protein [Methanocella sp. CWC-04]
MYINQEHLMEEDIRGIEDLDDKTEVCYPTGCCDMTKKELLAKLCELEFLLTGTWTHEFLDEYEEKYRKMSAAELAKVLCEKLQEIYDWDVEAYKVVLGRYS